MTTRVLVTPSAGADFCNTCPVCGQSLAGKHKTCSGKCRVALHRRNHRPDGGALVAVAQRVFATELREAQMAARRELREWHKVQREQLRDEYAAKSQSMRDELPESDERVANEFHERLEAKDDAGVLGRAIAEKDRQTN